MQICNTIDTTVHQPYPPKSKKITVKVRFEMNTQTTKRYLRQKNATPQKSFFVDVSLSVPEEIESYLSFIGKTGEDVWQCYTRLADPSCFRFGVYPDSIFPDVEETLDVARLLCSAEANYVPIISLEPSSFMTLQYMKPLAIEVQVCFPECGDRNMKQELLRYLVQRSKYPVWVQGDELSEEQIAIALDCGCVAAILPCEE